MASKFRTLLIAVACSLLLQTAIFAQDNTQKQSSPITWIHGPAVGTLGDVAQLKLPKGFKFTGKEGTQRLLEATQNPVNGNEIGAMTEDSQHPNFFVIFEFHDVGYVKDDDKDSLDADALLKSIQEGTEEQNKIRKEKGWPGFHVSGWDTKPFYDPDTHNLTWAIRGHGDEPAGSTASPDDETINYSTRILGRKGTMNVDLIVGTEEYQKSVAEFKQVMTGYNFTTGNKYSEFTKGDKLAGYGLAALVVGGGAATAAKLGLFAKLWKLILVGFAAVAAWFKKMWAKLTGKDKQPDVNQGTQIVP